MAERQPIAFLSYVRSDDDHDDGRITAFRKRLEGEVQMQTGKPFAIFQDRNDIAWGNHWEERINSSLSDVTFLIPILTPSFFQSPACRSEFQTFSLKEKTLGLNRLILPVYYVACDQLGDGYQKNTDEIVDTIRARNWTDWRKLRFKPLTDEGVAATMAGMAAMIKSSVKELKEIGQVETAKPKKSPPQGLNPSAEKLPKIVSEGEILSVNKSDTASANVDSADEPAYEIPEVNPSATADGTQTSATSKPYYVFTRRFDEVIEAKELAEESELLKLYNYVSNFAGALKELHGQQLEKNLSGFRKKTTENPLAVTILIDNSGSMRGSKIIHTAAWCVLIIDWMDRLGIPTEILGYTTRAWKGGQSRETWLASGKPANPGRLNDLRHLIYKPFSATAEVSAVNFGVMAREGLLKENVDGEALLWAASRLEIQEASRKILFVVSDGAPVDDSTLSVNPGNFLERHLLTVISHLSKKIRLYAIGLEHDVSRYYPNASSLLDTSYLGIRFFDTLVYDQAFRDSWSTESKKLIKAPRTRRRTKLSR